MLGSPLKLIIPADVLLKRWSISVDRLNSFVRDRVIFPYGSPDARTDATTGGIVYYCQRYTGIPETEFGTPEIDGIFFDIEQVEQIEKEHPELLSPVDYSMPDVGKEWIVGDELQRILKMSPAIFMKFVNQHKLPVYYETHDFGRVWLNQHDFEARIFVLHDIDEAMFHIVDLRELAPNIPQLAVLFPAAPEVCSPPNHESGPRVVTLEAELAQARQEIERLTLEIERLKAGAASEPLDCAACRADSPHSDEWTHDLECAVSFALELFQANEAGSTAYHEALWKERRKAPRKRAFAAFRRTLPGHLKEADPKKK